jgi:hypothetical protein
LIFDSSAYLLEEDDKVIKGKDFIILPFLLLNVFFKQWNAAVEPISTHLVRLSNGARSFSPLHVFKSGQVIQFF